MIYVFKRDKNNRRVDVATVETESEAIRLCYSRAGLEWTRDGEYGR